VVVATIDELRRSLMRTISCMAFSAVGVRSMQQVRGADMQTVFRVQGLGFRVLWVWVG
jgi:hypothetical protein